MAEEGCLHLLLDTLVVEADMLVEKLVVDSLLEVLMLPALS